MKIFVQSASVAEIREFASAGLLDGVVLSPVDLATEDPSATLLDRLAEITVDFGVPVCVPVSAIIGGAQAFIAAKLGASMVATDVREIDAQGRPSAEMVAQIRAVIDKCRLECDVAVTAPQSSIAFTSYLLAGADVAYVTPELFGSLLVHSLTDRGVDRYLSALSRRHKPRSL